MKEDLIKHIESKHKAVTKDGDRFFVWLTSIVVLLSVLSCKEQKTMEEQKLYEGPTLTMDSISTMMSDSAKVIVKLKAAKQNNLQNGDQEWPESIYLEYLDKNGEVISTFRADYVIYTEKERIYRAEGNVVVTNSENGDELNTEELFWDPNKEEFYTERFVTIKSGDEVHTGEGLRADQDFSFYKIMKPEGTILIEVEEE